MAKTILDDDVLFSIRQVAKMIGVVPATIRNWEKNGLFVARRTQSNYRVFDFHDINTLKKIKQYSIDDSMGSKAIKMLMQPGRHTAPDDIHFSKKQLSGKWKESREKMGLTLEEVSAQTDISPSYLSKIENAQVRISLSVMHKLASFYGESMPHYFESESSQSRLVRSGAGNKIDIDQEGVSMEILIGAKDHVLYPVLFSVEPGCGYAEEHSHLGEEFLYVLGGRLEIHLNGEKYIIKTGDSLSFRSKDTHMWFNPGRKTARVIWVHTPISR